MGKVMIATGGGIGDATVRRLADVEADADPQHAARTHVAVIASIPAGGMANIRKSQRSAPSLPATRPNSSTAASMQSIAL